MDNTIEVDESAMTESTVEYTIYEAQLPVVESSGDDDDKLPIILGGVFGGLAVLLIW